MAPLRWVHDRLKGAVNSWAEGLILVVGSAGALLIWRAVKSYVSDEVAIPMWIVAVTLGLITAVIWVQAIRLKARGAHAHDMTSLAIQIDQVRAVTAAYAEHLTEILYSFQRVVGGEIPGVTVKEWLEDGILEPARDLMRARQTEDVRLSILVPDGDDFIMAFGAGHTLESKRNFRLPIEQSYSKWAFRNAEIRWSGDLESDTRFTRHPKATPDRNYRSMISVPLRRGDTVVGVFNAIFAPSNAFDEPDLLYVRLIGALIELVWSLTDGPTGATEHGEPGD